MNRFPSARRRSMRGSLGVLAATAAAAAAMLGTATPVHALDVEAGDYTALPAGTTLGLVYYQHATRNKLYADGDRVGINPRLDSDVGILRGVRYMDIGGYIVDPQFLLPFGRLKASKDIAALGSETSMADLILAATVWFSKPGDKSHFGITPFLYLPTGNYDRNDALSLGENRWKLTLQAGYIAPLAEKWTVDLIGDFTIFGKNDDFGAASQDMKQKPFFDVQAHLRYHLSPATDLRAQLAHSFGGEQEVDGVDQDNRLSTTRLKFGFSHFVGPKTQLLATYNRDLKVREGFKIEHGVQFRVLQIF